MACGICSPGAWAFDSGDCGSLGRRSTAKPAIELLNGNSSNPELLTPRTSSASRSHCGHFSSRTSEGSRPVSTALCRVSSRRRFAGSSPRRIESLFVAVEFSVVGALRRVNPETTVLDQSARESQDLLNLAAASTYLLSVYALPPDRNAWKRTTGRGLS